ncbi:SMI1/KNR4 family protein [Undibacterium sp. JH2W]|uniref:SMI1/KNR4 family protein n=1 Tax=Undibacterium sp. JH2W TaxID=3413037 RepID=UPI003BF01DB1
MTFKYDEDTFVPFFSAGEMDAFKLQMKVDFPGFEYDPNYVAHISHFHGGRLVTKFFKTKKGASFPIERFLNFADRHLIQDKNIKGLGVYAIWSLIEDRLSICQFPFAILPGGDFLCFDYTFGLPPKIILWYHEGSKEGEPCVEVVADDFVEFINVLSAVELW